MTQPNPIYFETLDKNAHFLTDKITISAAEIRKFATQFDPQPYHTDRIAAESSIFGGLCASGWHVCAIMMKLLSDTLASKNIKLIGSDHVPFLKWHKPAFEGHELYAELNFDGKDKNETDRNFGTVLCNVKLLNQENSLIMELQTKLMIEKKGANID